MTTKPADELRPGDQVSVVQVVERVTQTDAGIEVTYAGGAVSRHAWGDALPEVVDGPTRGRA